MSKSIKRVGRALKKVVKGVAKVAKKIIKSPIGKAIGIAAAVYFGGAAIGGMMSGAGGAGAGVIGNATAGISNAWSGLTGAASAAMGGNFSQAGSMLAAGAKGGLVAPVAGSMSSVPVTGIGAGISGTNTAAMSSLAPVTSGTAGAGSIGGIAGAGVGAPSAVNNAINVLKDQAPTLLTKEAGGGLLSKALSSPYTIPMALQIGGQAAASKAQEEQAEEERQRYNDNVGAKNLYTSRY